MRKTNLRRVFSAFLVLSFMLTQSGGVVPEIGTNEVRAAVSIEELTNLITTAQVLHDGADEGTAVGNYEIGSKAVFQAAINAAKASRTYYEGSDDHTVIAPAINNLNNAIATFEAREVSASEADGDGDSILDEDDNCPLIANSGQADIDGDGIGDVCDDDNGPVDTDGDSILDEADNCPLVSNADQKNTDEDTAGDACDDDDDNDGVADEIDNCQFVSNPDQVDSNGDYIGDACTDNVKPVISLLGTSPVDVFVGSVYTDAGATAVDDVDGDLTAKVDANTSAIDTSTVGTFTVTYNVSDTAGNPAEAKVRIVNVINEENDEGDTVKPIITLSGSSPVEVFVGDTYVDAGATATDNVDETLIIDVINPVNTSAVNIYTVTYNTTDKAGNEAIAVTRTVNVVAKQTSGGGGSSFIPQKFVPEGGAILINTGNDKTANRNVALVLTAPNAKMMALSNNADFADSSWETFAQGVEWILTEGNGEKTVYAKFKNTAGNESAVYTDTIILGVEDVTIGEDNDGVVLGDNTVGIYDGDLIQCKTSSVPNAVYVVKIVGTQRFIRQIKSDFFKYYKHLNWEDVRQVGSLDGFVISRWVRINTGKNGDAIETDKVYEINGDWTEHWLNMTKEQFYAKGGSEAAIFNINKGELGSYAAGPNVSIS